MMASASICQNSSDLSKWTLSSSSTSWREIFHHKEPNLISSSLYFFFLTWISLVKRCLVLNSADLLSFCLQIISCDSHAISSKQDVLYRCSSRKITDEDSALSFNLSLLECWWLKQLFAFDFWWIVLFVQRWSIRKWRKISSLLFRHDEWSVQHLISRQNTREN